MQDDNLFLKNANSTNNLNEKDVDSKFAERVEAIVRQIPKGRVMTYGQIAAICGNARAARIVGGVAHFGDPELPWQRVVNKTGGLAAGYPGGRAAHGKHLEAEGVEVSEDYRVDVNRLLWSPAEFTGLAGSDNTDKRTKKPGATDKPEQQSLI